MASYAGLFQKRATLLVGMAEPVTWNCDVLTKTKSHSLLKGEFVVGFNNWLYFFFVKYKSDCLDVWWRTLYTAKYTWQPFLRNYNIKSNPCKWHYFNRCMKNTNRTWHSHCYRTLALHKTRHNESTATTELPRNRCEPFSLGLIIDRYVRLGNGACGWCIAKGNSLCWFCFIYYSGVSLLFNLLTSYYSNIFVLSHQHY